MLFLSNPETQIPEYNKNGQWFRAAFGPEVAAQPEKGMLKLTEKGNPVTPQYYLHFTVGFLKNGFYSTLEFPEGSSLTNAAKPLELEVGQYVLITGNRQQDGAVLSQMTFFSIEKNKLTTIPVKLREESGELKPSGKLNFEALNLQKTSDGKTVSLSSVVSGKYTVLVLLDPDKEP